MKKYSAENKDVLIKELVLWSEKREKTLLHHKKRIIHYRAKVSFYKKTLEDLGILNKTDKIQLKAMMEALRSWQEDYQQQWKEVNRVKEKIAIYNQSLAAAPKPSNNCPDAPKGISCVLYHANKIDWDDFKQNPKKVKRILKVEKSTFKTHQQEFEAFLKKYYGITVDEKEGKISFMIPQNSPYVHKYEKEGSLYIIELNEGKLEPQPSITTINQSEWDEKKLQEIEARFEQGMQTIHNRIVPYITSQIMVQVDINIVHNVQEVAQGYIAFYEELKTRKGLSYADVLARHYKTYENMKALLKEQGELNRIVNLAEEYFDRSVDRQKTSIDDNPELNKKNLGKATYKDSTIQELYKKGKGDNNDVDPNDVQQGRVGDCYFLSSVAAIARYAPDAIKDLIKGPDKDGNYTVTLYPRESRASKTRIATAITVQPEFATDKNGDLLYAKAGDQELWVMILEKAFAQIMGGYDNIDFGFGTEAMAMLTNKEPKLYSLDKIEEEAFFERLKVCIKNKVPVTISSRGMGEQRVIVDEERVVISGHVYSLEKIKGKSIFLHNPWGKDHINVTMEELIKYFRGANILEI